MKGVYSKIRLCVFGIFLIVAFSSCGEEVLNEGLTEKDANEIIAVLHKYDIDALKEKVESSQSLSYKISVSKEEFAKARQILQDYNLPREKNIGKIIEDVCGSRGSFASPSWEKCRQKESLQAQISQYLESDSIPEVVKARVIITLPEEDILSLDEGKKKKPTASAAIRMIRVEEDNALNEARIQRYIANAVKDLDPRDVEVLISYVQTEGVKAEKPPANGAEKVSSSNVALSSVLGLEMSQDSTGRFKIYAAVFLVLLILMSAVLIVNVMRSTRIRQELKVARVQLGGVDVQELPVEEAAPKLEEAQNAEGPEQLPPGS